MEIWKKNRWFNKNSPSKFWALCWLTMEDSQGWVKRFWTLSAPGAGQSECWLHTAQWLHDAGWAQEAGARWCCHGWGRKPVEDMAFGLGFDAGFPNSSVVKESVCNAGDPGLIPGSGRSTGEGVGYPLQYSWASLVVQLVKNPPTMQETWVCSLGWEGPLEKGKATHSSILAWRIPWTG